MKILLVKDSQIAFHRYRLKIGLTRGKIAGLFDQKLTFALPAFGIRSFILR